jgi:hypothetical protein
MIGTVLALGGGGFSMSDDGTSAIDDYLLELTGRSRPRVCFVPTASGDAEVYGRRDGAVVEAVAERPGRPAFKVERDGSGEAVEIEVPVRLLG